ncbi:MAG: aldehyde dehydrogenase family protein [Alphaproteobacteria bacterium]|nr:aldehyde dehydrogenase family protein [Alphaproteobacteria bacterium]
MAQNYINGQWVDSNKRIDIENPATGEVFANIAHASESDVDKAVQAARECHLSRALVKVPPSERGRMVRKMGEYLLQNKQEIAHLLTLESGKPLWESLIEVASSARYFEYYGAQADTMEGRSVPLGDGYYDFTHYEPYGVSAMIIPWNYPLEMTARSLSAALTTGNACVVKTPELDPLTNCYLALAAEYAGFPAGAVNLICGYGHDTGAALANHPLINQLVFTGSVATGVSVATAAAQNIVPCVLELGGKSAAIAYEDADLDNLVESVRWGVLFGAGQTCSAMSRLIVHQAIYDEVVEKIATMMQNITVGAGVDDKDMGPMISEKQRNRAENMCIKAEQQGAQAAFGGRRLNRDGWFLPPTLYHNVTPDMELAQQEVFGPVLAVMKFTTEDEALAISNGTDYGLVAGVFTRDIDRAMRAAQRIEAGQIFINEWFAGGIETPFGGYKKSGYGREKGREALLNYVQTKNIAVRISSVR